MALWTASASVGWMWTAFRITSSGALAFIRSMYMWTSFSAFGGKHGCSEYLSVGGVGDYFYEAFGLPNLRGLAVFGHLEAHDLDVVSGLTSFALGHALRGLARGR